jgi:hypothetical protein
VWLSSVTPDRLETFVKAGFSVWVCTLYVPAGHVSSHKVTMGSDFIGLRLGCLAMASDSVMQHLFASRAALNQPLNEALQEGLKLLEERVCQENHHIQAMAALVLRFRAWRNLLRVLAFTCA